MSKLRTLSIGLALALGFHFFLSSMRTATAVGNGDSAIDIGLVDMERIFSEFYKSGLATEEIEKTKAVIASEIREKKATRDALVSDLQLLEKKMNDPTLSETIRRQHQATAQTKLAEARTLDADMNEYTNRRKRQLLLEGQESKKKILDEISLRVKEVARAEGLDAVFDQSGLSDIGFPFVVFVENPTDLSDRIIEVLNEGAPKTAIPMRIK